MHEWLSGGASPCQGEGRGFESRLVLFLLPEIPCSCEVFRAFVCLKSCTQHLFVFKSVFNWDYDKRRTAYNALEMRV